MTTPLEPAPTRVVLLSDDPFECPLLTVQLRPFGYVIECVEDLADLKRAVQSTETPFVLISDRPVPDREAYDAEVASLAELTPAPRIVYLLSRLDAYSRFEEIRAHASSYASRPYKGFDVVRRLEELRGYDDRAPFRALLVEGDPAASRSHEAMLNKDGFITKIVSDRSALPAHFAEFQPELIVIDCDPPDFNARELAVSIRQGPAYEAIPIIFLVAKHDRLTRRQVSRIDGAEYLTKPITATGLTCWFANQAHYFRVLRATKLRDTLTDLPNQTAIKEQATVIRARMRRQGSRMVFALVAIDHFETMNDTHGRPVGDQVIRSLSHLLKECLRDTDIIGRHGREEFAVVMPDTPNEGGALVMDRIRARFESITHSSARGEFRASFSCGVAGFPAHRDPEEIMQAADEALAAAKRAGGNQVRTPVYI